MIKIELVDYVRSSCKLAEQFQVIKYIYGETNGKPCDGCAYQYDGCSAKTTLMDRATRSRGNGKRVAPEETNKQTATRMGITPRQVSKMKKKMRQDGVL
jgi:hypothetical protein